MSLPTLDASRFTCGPEAGRLKFAHELVECLKEYGFVKLANHGVSVEAINSIFQWSKRFFDLPLETRMRIAYKGGLAPLRGYSYVGQEVISRITPTEMESEGAKDRKENLDLGPPTDQEFPNCWLPESDFPKFRESMESYYTLCQEISLFLLHALEIGLDLPKGSFTDRCTPAASELRLNHYPITHPPKSETGKAYRAFPHTDIGVITLLFQDREGGLEFEDRKNPGSFLPALSQDSTDLIVNVADTLERWTNGVLKAGLHQVTISESMVDKTHGNIPQRFSAVFFLKGSARKSAGPLPDFVSLVQPAKYDEITALEYLQRRHRLLYDNFEQSIG